MRMAGVAHTKTSKEMENHVFMKAKTRDEYLSLVARLIIHFRDIRNKCTCLFFSPDPMNALQNLTGGPPAGPGAMGMASRPQGASLAGMSGLGPPMGQPMNLPGQQPPGTAGMAPHGIPNIPATSQPSKCLGQAPAQLQLQQMAAQQQQQQQQFQQQQQQAALQQQQQQFQAQQSAMQQQQFQVQQQQQAAAVAQQQMQVVQQQQQMLKLQLHQQSQQQVRAKASTSPSLSCPAAADRKALARPAPVVILGREQHHHDVFSVSCPASPDTPANASPASATAFSSVWAAQLPTQLQCQVRAGLSVEESSSRWPVSAPGVESSSSSSSSSGPAPSPSSFLPSPSPQPSQSPAAARTPQNFSVPSPGPLNTPGNPSSVMSPASSSQSEEQQYLEKLKQLSKYIEPLRRMINKIDKNEDRKKDLSKMKSLLDILTDPKKRCPLKTLQKCEIALEKLKNDMAVPTPPPPAVPPTKQQYLCQPLLDAVLANIRSPVFNHSLYRTFMPAVTAIHGPPIMTPVPSPRKRKYEDDERQTIPNVLQGEVARLNPKFLVNLDPAHCSNNGTVHLICKIDDKNLPSVPPLQLSVPADYPEQSPLWIDNPQQYEANPFLQSVYRYMMSKLLQLPDKHSVTALLNTWAQSIRQACLSAA
uniref:Mediator of RNA polymerase II transcription subunit 15 n=1 Tax=Naja naja TaxID=35670 RepID=A0A8C6YFR6_NAJNA